MDDNFWKGKNVLITGGTSFVGKNLTKKLDALGATYFTFGSSKYDLTKKDDAEKAFQTGKYDFVIHMAALQHAADWPMHHTAEQFYVNGLIQINSLEAWRKFQPDAKMIAVGSSCCYPGKIPRLKEEDIDQGDLHDSVYAYGATKRLLGIGLRAYADQHKNLRGIMPMFATLYGPYDDFDLKTAHVVGALVAKFCDAKKESLPSVEVWGGGTQTRELIFIEDQIDGLLMAAQHFEGDPSSYCGQIINIGAGKEISIKDLAETIKKVSGYSGEIVYNTNKFVGVKNKVLDITKAKNEIGWTEKNKMHTLEEGLKKTIDWYSRNN
ncbi:MAG: NAD-dependent epimerase/dehydratase family protein [archaeon]